MLTEPIFWVSYFALWILTLVLFAAVFFLYRFHGQMFVHSAEGRINQGPNLDHFLPKLTVRDLDGAEMFLGGGNARQQLIFLASPKCRPCARARSDLKTFAETYRQQIQTVIVCSGDSHQVAKFTKVLSSQVRVVHDPKWDIGTAVRVTTTPFAFIVDKQGIVRAKGMPDNLEGFEWFVNQSVAFSDQPTLSNEVGFSQVP